MQLEDILVEDRQLAKEILHDIRQAEHEENLRKTQCQRSSAPPGSGQPITIDCSRTGGRHQPRCPGPSRLGNAATAGRLLTCALELLNGFDVFSTAPLKLCEGLLWLVSGCGCGKLGVASGLLFTLKLRGKC